MGVSEGSPDGSFSTASPNSPLAISGKGTCTEALTESTTDSMFWSKASFHLDRDPVTLKRSTDVVSCDLSTATLQRPATATWQSFGNETDSRRRVRVTGVTVSSRRDARVRKPHMDQSSLWNQINHCPVTYLAISLPATPTRLLGIMLWSCFTVSWSVKTNAVVAG